MDLINSFVNFQQSSTLASVQMAVARKVLDAQRADGNAALQLLAAADQNAAQAGDQLAAAATGLGGMIDVYG